MKNINKKWLKIILAIILASIYLYNGREDFVQGFEDGYNSARPERLESK